MIKATLIREIPPHGRQAKYFLMCDDIALLSSVRKPSAEKMRKACKPALGEEVIITDKTQQE